MYRITLPFEHINNHTSDMRCGWMRWQDAYHRIKSGDLDSVFGNDIIVLHRPLSNHQGASEVVTAHFGYIRFHGRNKKEWWAGDNRTRYDYLYSDQELQEWLPRIRHMAKKTETLFVFFNNHWKGQAVLNARRLKELLQEFMSNQ